MKSGGPQDEVADIQGYKPGGRSTLGDLLKDKWASCTSSTKSRPAGLRRRATCRCGRRGAYLWTETGRRLDPSNGKSRAARGPTL